MYDFRSTSGLSVDTPSPVPDAPEPEDVITEEAGIRPPPGEFPRVRVLVEEDETVAQGAAVACLRDAPEVRFVASMPGRVGRISLLPGRKLSEIVLFHEATGDVADQQEGASDTESGLRRLMQRAGIWPLLRRRPFGGMPGAGERPAAIVVMAADTRPDAPDPRRALMGREEDFGRGVEALATLTDGSVFVCGRPGPPLFDGPGVSRRVRSVTCGARHPQGSAGIRIHDLCPARIQAPVWDVHGEDVAALGALLRTGRVPMSRHVVVAGPALRSGRFLRTQPGADLRELTRRVALPGAHQLLSGSSLDGHQAQWLGPRDRQVTVVPRPTLRADKHWLASALVRSSQPRPVIPTAALSQAMGAALPASAFVRALGSGDEETAIGLGILSLLEEDVALADYVLGGDMHLGDLLRGMLDSIRAEHAA